MATQEAQAKTGQLGDNERLQQLMEEFPEVPPIVVMKTDLIREGIRPSPATRQAGRWALPDAHDYFEYDKEDTHTAEEAAEGYTLSPIACYFRHNVSYRFMFDSRSPYEIRYEERGRYRLYRDGDPLEEVFFPTRPQWYDRKTSSGKPMSSVISMRTENSMFLVPLNYCEYFKDNLGCRYCNIVPSESTKKDLGLERMLAKRDQDVYESFVAGIQECGIRSITMSGGVILNPSKEADNYARLARVLKRAMKDAGREVSIGVKCQAMEAEDQMKLKEAGVSSIGFNMEVWDPRLFDIICPGKAKYVGRQGWIDRMLKAVEIWGSSNTSFVLGIELAPPYGFKTEDQAAESVLEGWDWLMPRGVFPGGSPWRCVPGTEFAGMSSPRTEYFLRMVLAHHNLAVKHKKVPTAIDLGQSTLYDWARVEPPKKASAQGPSAPATTQTAC